MRCADIVGISVKDIIETKRITKSNDKYVCAVCGYVYDPEVGAPTSAIAPGTKFEDLPEDWACPLCEVLKSFTILPTVKSKTSIKATVETKLKDIPRKIYLQYAGKEIAEDDLIEKFKFEWCKQYKITELNNFKIYYKFEDKKAYFVANASVTIVIRF